MPYIDLYDFLDKLEKKNDLVRIKTLVDPELEVTEILNRLLKSKGPAVIFENVKDSRIQIAANLFGTTERVAYGLETTEEELIDIGRFLAYLEHPQPPSGLIDAVKHLPFYGRILNLSPKKVKKASCQEVVLKGKDIDLSIFPILKCWPQDAGRLITWPLVITKAPDNDTLYNMGVYRMQVISNDRTIMRWLNNRGGRRHYRMWMEKGRPMPVAVTIGNDPATIIAAVTPVPERVSEFHFAGVLRKKGIEIVKCVSNDLYVPANSEIVLEGEIWPDDMAMEGPFGDHTGYYNPQESYPVFRINCITHRRSPLYLTTVTGRPPREDAIVGLALNRIFLPILQQNFPEVMDFHLPMEALSYRIAVISIKKEYPGHAKRIMMGLWGSLLQFLFVKYIIVVDPDIDVRNWDDICFALAANVDPVRDVTIIENTPIDYLDFSSSLPELGSKMGIDATTKVPPETQRQWGKRITMDNKIIEKIDRIWNELGIDI
ncbi:MAG: UbiD family decarboxylase [Nitrospirota bacterium]